MTEIRSPHHFQPIPAEDTDEIRPWRLPFWTEPPAWLVEKEQKKAQEAAAAAAKNETVDDIDFPTAEELENIRRDAYNAGLEQGLVEGRQQGRKDGFAEGHDEGYKAAFEQGQKDGREQGFRTGEEEGKRKAQADINAVVRRLEKIIATLQSTIAQRDQQLPDVLASLVGIMCERVLMAEFSDGALNIHQYVRRALDELPAGEDNYRVFVGPDDARHLRNSLEITGEEMHFSVDESLPAGACRVESEHSLVEYSAREHLEQLIAHIQPHLLHAATTYPDERELVEWDAPDVVEEPVSAVAEQSLPETSGSETAEAVDAESPGPSASDDTLAVTGESPLAPPQDGSDEPV